MRDMRHFELYLRSSLFSYFAAFRHLHSFPTRRSSDLGEGKAFARRRPRDHEPLHGGDLRSRPTRAAGVHDRVALDRKSTRLNSSHTVISYAVYCLKKKMIAENEKIRPILAQLEKLLLC